MFAMNDPNRTWKTSMNSSSNLKNDHEYFVEDEKYEEKWPKFVEFGYIRCNERKRTFWKISLPNPLQVEW